MAGRREFNAREFTVFCTHHDFPHEDCPDCMETVAAMRPTVFAELAAAELRSGTESCHYCDFVFVETVHRCPRCARPHRFHADHSDALA